MAKIDKQNRNLGKINSPESLKTAFAVVENRKKAFNAKKLFDANETKKLKAGLLQEIFQMMRDAGVDLSNLESINQFLTSLGQKDPDLLMLFEEAFNGLLSGEEEGGMMANNQPTPVSNPTMMNSFENLRNLSFNR